MSSNECSAILQTVVVLGPAIALKAEASKRRLLFHLLLTLCAVGPFIRKSLQNFSYSAAGVTLKYI